MKFKFNLADLFVEL